MATKYSDEDNVTFSILNQDVVDRLVRDGDIILPAKKVAVPKDQRWNTKLMTSKVLQGIQNGDSPYKISKSMMEVVGNNKASAIRNARTMTTSAENHGRLDSYKKLDSQGVVMKKEWEATPDDRTRPSHVDIDGEEQDLDKPFSNGCQFPGDGRGPAEEVWMCRCAMGAHILGFRRADGSVSMVNYNRDRTLHDEQMADEKARRMTAKSRVPKVYVVKLGDTGARYTKNAQSTMLQMLSENQSMSRNAYLEYVDRLQASIQPDKDGAYYRSDTGRVYLRPRIAEKGSRHQTPLQVHFHEYGHNIDYLAGNGSPVSMAYRDAQGRSFEQIINSEWQRHLNERAMWKNFQQNLDVSNGGMGASNWLKFNIKEWRQSENIRWDDARFSVIWEKAKAIESMPEATASFEAMELIQNNIDIFIKKEYNVDKADIESFCKEIKEQLSLRSRSDISDMFETFSVQHGGPAYPFGVGHGKEYTEREGALAKEAFAEMFSAEITNEGSLEAIKKYLPESYKAFQEILGGIL